MRKMNPRYQLEEKSPYARSKKGGRGGFQNYGDAYEEDWDHELETDGTTPRPASDKSPDMCLTTAQLQMRYPGRLWGIQPRDEVLTVT